MTTRDGGGIQGGVRRLGCLVLLVAASVAGAHACSARDGEGASGATVPRSTAPRTGAPATTSAAPTDAHAVPATIDADYVDRVMAALNRVYGDVIRRQVETRTFTPADLADLRAIYGDDETFQVGQALAQTPPEPRHVYHDPIGDRRSTVDHLLAVGHACVYFRAVYDSSAVSAAAAPPKPAWVVLRPKPPENDPRRLNPTPWVIAFEEFEEPEPQCD